MEKVVEATVRSLVKSIKIDKTCDVVVNKLRWGATK